MFNRKLKPNNISFCMIALCKIYIGGYIFMLDFPIIPGSHRLYFTFYSAQTIILNAASLMHAKRFHLFTWLRLSSLLLSTTNGKAYQDNHSQSNILHEIALRLIRATLPTIVCAEMLKNYY